MRSAVVWGLILITLGLPASGAGPSDLDTPPPASPPNRVKRFILKPRSGHWEQVQLLHQQTRARVVRTLQHLNNLQIVEFPAGAERAGECRQSGLFEFIEPESYATPRGLPAEPLMVFCPTNRIPYEVNPRLYARDTYQWQVDNTGQSIELFQNLNGNWGLVDGPEPAVTNASLHALEAWPFQEHARGVTVGLIDSGIDLAHPELAGVLSTNSAGGWNAIAVFQDAGPGGPLMVSQDVQDIVGHGTECAGVIAANWNGQGIAGLAPGVKLVVAKTATYSLSEILICLDYCLGAGVRLINCSWGFATNSPALREAFVRAREAGVLCVAAVLNDEVDYDTGVSDYPIQWRQSPLNPDGLDNLLAVTSTSLSDQRFVGGWGRHTVDLGAPGRLIPTTGISSSHPYVYVSGSSVATALTTGCAALLIAQHPQETCQTILCRLRAAVDPIPDLVNTTISGGRLNLYKALSRPPAQLALGGLDSSGLHLECSNAIPGVSYVIQYSSDLLSWTNLTTFIGTTNSVRLADRPEGPQRFYRLGF